MKKILNIAVFGLSLNMLDQLKGQILLAVPNGIQVQWVNIAEQKIDLLMVNDAFFQSSSIQKILSHHGMPYLRLLKTSSGGGKIEADSLSYPVEQLTDLQEWLQEKFFDYEPLYTFKPAPAVSEEKVNISTIISECLLPRNGYIQLFDSSGFLALVDTMTERVWVNGDNPMLSFNKSLNQTYATSQFVQETSKNKKAQDLRNWLWQAAFRSAALDLPKIQLNQYFQLEIWPQFDTGYERRDLLKISACFAQGAQLQSVADHLNISHERLIKFVAITHLLKMGKWIEPHEAQFMRGDKSADSNQMIKLRGFFGKLRKKLGL